MKSLLIVNADDCNLTPGVTQAILDCHDRGILTSTTFMINLPLESSTVRNLLRRNKLGVGLHLNVTFGKPVSKPAKVKSLLGEDGKFKKMIDYFSGLGRKSNRSSSLSHQLVLEYQNQINLFRKAFGRLPTHLDTHHQVHDHPFFFEVLSKVAQKNKLPFRRSRLTREARRSPEFIFGNLTVEGYWRKEALETILKNMPSGISEMMCHPGKNDAALRAVSSFTTGREAEYKLFSSPALKDFTLRQGITLTHFGLCYT